MNLDRLLKLLKLANHNPNDAEANSAARAATKLLGEENYKWLEDAKKNGGKPLADKNGKSTYSEWYNPATREYNIKFSTLDLQANPKISELVIQLEREVKGARTWNDVHRTTEPDFRSQRTPPRGNPFEYGDNPFRDGGPFNPFGDSFWEDIDRKTRQEREKKKAENRKAREEKAQNWTWNGERSGDKGYKKVYTQECRDCSVCKITRLTTDEATPYVCYSCKMKV